MAENKRKTQAEQAASSAKNRSRKSTASSSSASRKDITPMVRDRSIPPRAISATTFLAVFIFLLVIFFKSDGALIVAMENIMHGLIGRAAFIVAIPVTLYLFVIHAFSGKRPVIARTVCLGVFVLICGCLSHLSKNAFTFSKGFRMISELYIGGINGSTGGVICGLITVFFHWLVGTPITYILLGCSAVLTLLGGMQITIPSIIRAIQDRPRADWEDLEPEREEPAAVVVNHIARKRIQHIENKRIRMNQEVQSIPEPPVPDSNRKELSSHRSTGRSGTQAEIAASKVSAIMSQIEGDVQTPVAAAEVPEKKEKCEKESREFVIPETEDVPAEMPPLESKIVEVPVDEKPVAPPVQKVTAKDTQENAAKVAKEIEDAQSVPQSEYCYPPVDLLTPSGGCSGDGTAEMRENSRRLNETLASFKIEAHIINVTRGPSVTRYEVELEKGVRLNKLTTAADDIALSLGATGVRIAAIPGKISVVGIEVPNRAVTMVSLREVIDSAEFKKAKSKSSFAVGKDIGGNCIVGNIAKLPHMLIAGTTGSGKSVCMNSIIISLLYKASPDDVKLIMVDPKMVELGIYNGIPHLLIPVVTDPKKAAGSLQWAVTEMMRRYKAMSDAGVRDLKSYNSIMENQEESGKKLPQVVVIIDELADLMLVAAKEVEESICRIAQMGRAAGIHLIIATQRPSADVITGLMKANIPSRIAFAVASAMESRIILDTQGAEKLVGKGDMLYAPIGNGKPKRVQGCFVSDPEVEAVASYVKEHHISDYNQDVIEEIERKAAQTGTKSSASDPEPNADELDSDEMLPAAVDVILDTKQASVSMLQRRLKLGYARAARIVDEMEERGIVGPFQGSKPREILITREQWESMKSGQPSQMEFDDLDQAEDEQDESEEIE